MQLTLDTGHSTYRIQGYESGKLIVNNEIIAHNVIVMPNQLCSWSVQTLADLSIATLRVILELRPELVLLGTGTTQHFIDPALLVEFYTVRVGVEVMPTAAACRTYNVLMAEGRNVAASLLLI